MSFLDQSYEDIRLSFSQYSNLENFIKNQFIHPKHGLRNNSEEFQNAITKVIEYIDKVNSVIKNSEKDDEFEETDNGNESAAADILKLKYLNLYFFKHVLTMKKQAVITTTDKSEMIKLENLKNQFRLKFLNESTYYGLEYLNKLTARKILNGKNPQQLISLQKMFNEDNKSNIDYDNVIEIWSKIFPNDRDSRMANFKFKKMVEQQITEFEANLKKKIPELFDNERDREDYDDDLSKVDDEVRVQYNMLLVLNLQKNSIQCIGNIDSNLQEIQLLQRFLTTAEVNDFHRSKTLMKDNYHKSDKLDTQTITPHNISKIYGKNYSNVNFNLKNDQVQQIQSKIKGFGQYAPTQTIDDLLEEEIAQGRIITQTGEKLSYNDIKNGNFLKNKKQNEKNAMENVRLTEEEINEDNYNYLDAKTYEARDWDKFKESVTKGSGNMGRRKG